MVFQLTTNIGEQMKKEKQYPKDNREGVPTLVYQWGPTLARMEIDEALKMILIDEYENNKKNKQLPTTFWWTSRKKCLYLVYANSRLCKKKRFWQSPKAKRLFV